MWYGLVAADGDLVSIGTEAMFEGGIRPEGSTYANCDIIEFGNQSPNFSQKIWDKNLRALVNRPAPILISRLDDIESWLLADPDFQAMWSGLNATRRQQLRNGWRRVIARLLGANQWRGESDEVEI